MTEQFRTRPGGFNEIKKRMLIRRIPIALIAVIGGFAITLYNTGNLQSNSSSLLFTVIICLAVLGYGWYVSIKRNKEIFDSYILTIDDNSISREEINTPSIKLAFRDIKEIARNKNNSFTIRGRAARDVIFVPAQMAHYEKVEVLLSRIMPITKPATHPLKKAYLRMLPVLVIGLMLAVYLSDNKVVVVASGSLLTVQILWLFYEARRSKNIDSQTKRTVWLIIFVLASVVATIILKLI